jgi:hypothetical protein
MKRLAIFGAVAAIAAVLAVLLGHDSRATDAQLAAFSTAGTSVPLSARERRLARHMGAREVLLLATRNGRAYYRFASPAGTCFGAGPADQIGLVTGASCPKENTFPTRPNPVLDYSVYEGMSHDRDGGVSLYRAEGFAADGVAFVAFLRPNGDVALKVPVRANVFSADPPRGRIAGIVAYDAAGKEVWRSP